MAVQRLQRRGRGNTGQLLWVKSLSATKHAVQAFEELRIFPLYLKTVIYIFLDV